MAVAVFATPAVFLAAGEAFAAEKDQVPSVVKEVREGAEWGKQADASSGENVDYRAIGTVHGNVGEYSTYSYTFVDTLPDGLVADLSSVKVFLDDKNLPSSDVTVSLDGKAMKVAIADLKPHGVSAASKVRLEYSCTIDPRVAKSGVGGTMTNVVYIVTSDGTGKEFKTNEDDAEVLTWELQLAKCSSVDGKRLADAGFSLRRMSDKMIFTTAGTWVSSWDAETCVFKTDGDGMLRFKYLDSGDYEIIEALTPSGYKVLERIIPVRISWGFDKMSLELEAEHDHALVSDVNAQSGHLLFSVVNEPDDGPTPVEPDDEPESSSQKPPKPAPEPEPSSTPEPGSSPKQTPKNIPNPWPTPDETPKAPTIGSSAKTSDEVPVLALGGFVCFVALVAIASGIKAFKERKR